MKTNTKNFSVNFNQENDGLYVVIVKCSGDDVVITKKGNYAFDDLNEAIQVKNDLGKDLPELEANVYLIQMAMDEYGQTTTELVALVA